MTVIILASSSADFETIPASWAYNMPHTALRTHAKGFLLLCSDFSDIIELHQMSYNGFVFAEAYQYDVTQQRITH